MKPKKLKPTIHFFQYREQISKTVFYEGSELTLFIIYLTPNFLLLNFATSSAILAGADLSEADLSGSDVSC